MKLISAEFENFRALHSIKIAFSVDPNKRMTVIRAENESGKTTMHYALQWGLYGEEGLPDKEYNIWPINTNPEHVKVTIDYEVVEQNSIRGRVLEKVVRYKLVRTASRYGQRKVSDVKLYEIGDDGSESVEGPEMTVEQQLPSALRKVFFTDGDRALSFIEGGNYKKPVKEAIGSLLGVKIVEKTLRHIVKYQKQVEKEVNEIATQWGRHTPIEDTNNAKKKLDQLTKEREKLGNELENIDKRLKDIDGALQDAERKAKGEQKLANINEEIDSLKERIKATNSEHALIFKNKNICGDLLAGTLSRASSKLQKYQGTGKILRTAILEDRLLKGTCICGESLLKSKPGGMKRRQYINQRIHDNKKMDNSQKMMSSLYHDINEFVIETKNVSWLSDYENIATKRINIEDELVSKQRSRKNLIGEIEAISEGSIVMGKYSIANLKDLEKNLKDEKENVRVKLIHLDEKVNEAEAEYERCEKDLDMWEKQKGKQTRDIKRYRTVDEVGKVLKDTKEQLLQDELNKTSKLMDEIFLKMILADPDRATIKKASINKDFKIVVNGPENKKLNPNMDLNGASRRALTMSFILALVGVSEVNAPNVIDTPLGMTSGHIRTSILKTIIDKSTQLVLFLTRAEIQGCEEIIGRNAGIEVTLTNTTHYPKILVNNPNKESPQMVLCKCRHNEDCNICKRRDTVFASNDVMEESQ